MSYTRILVRRGTATEWTTANPILASGEFGYETNTGKFKIGNGSSNWNALQYYVTLDAVKASIVDSAPAALDTLNELAAALGDDQNFGTTVLGAIADKAPLDSPTFTGTVDFSGATVSGVMLPINWTGTYQSAATYAENDLVEYNGNVYYAVGPNVNGIPPGVAGSDWDLFSSKGDTGPTGPTGPQGVGFNLTSTTSINLDTISPGYQTLTVDKTAQNSSFLPGTLVRVASTSNPSQAYLLGNIETYSGNTLTMYVNAYAGSGTVSSWSFTIVGYNGATGPAGSPGTAATVDVGNTYSYTGPEGSFVVNAGTTTDAILDFYLAPGPTGPTGPVGVVPDQQLIEISQVNYTITSSDVDNMLYTSNSSETSVYINIANVLQPGQQIDFMQYGTANLVIQPSGVNLYSSVRGASGSVKTYSRYSVASVKCISASNYIVYGEILIA